MRSLYLFDLDHTLLKQNVSFKFGLFLYKMGCFSLKRAIFLSFFYLLHRLHLMSIRKLHQAAIHFFFFDKSLREVEKLMSIFLDRSLETMLFPPVWKQLQMAKSRKDYTVILSSSPHFVVQAVAKRLNVDEWQATEYLVDAEGRIKRLGTFLGGQEKANHLSRLSKELGVKKENIYAFSDSYEDLPLLEGAGNVTVVYPCWKLRRAAKKHSWAFL